MSEKYFAARIGLDWADVKHDYCLRDELNQKIEHGVFKHTPESIDKWASELKDRFNHQPVAICLELKSGPIVSCLLQYDFIALFFVVPQALANYRKIFTQSGAKDDPTDAFLQLDYLTKHFSDLQEVKLDQQNTRMLDQLTYHRKSFVDEKVKIVSRLTAALKNYYPLMLDVFTDLDTILFCDFVERWPNLSKLKDAKQEKLSSFFKSHRSGRIELINQRVELIHKAIPLTNDEAVINPQQRFVLGQISLLKSLLKTIKSYDSEITSIFEQHEDHDIFASFPGAGEHLAPRLLAAFGTDRSAFSNAEEVQKYSGIAPVLVRSGKKACVHWRFKCSKFLRQSFVEFANQSIRLSFWAKTFYEQNRKKGKSHQATIRALAFKWIRIMYRCWKNHTTYDEATYLFALKKRNNKMA
ncbi:MAG: IS110 family transposase [Alteromonadaceae bacterium]|nr:IS110 family transposase [Alteromonadaceae bacterium]